MLRRNLKINRIKRIIKKEKRDEIKKIDKTGSNYPVDLEKKKNWRLREDKCFPPLL
tara:strand:+ start:332 stop:499 length:168 start_codon:yes stop_codon:yes gene_type:complete